MVDFMATDRDALGFSVGGWGRRWSPLAAALLVTARSISFAIIYKQKGCPDEQPFLRTPLALRGHGDGDQ